MEKNTFTFYLNSVGVKPSMPLLDKLLKYAHFCLLCMNIASYPGQQPAPGYPQQPGFQPQGVPPPPSGTQYYPPQQQPMVARQTTYTTQVVVVGGCPACRVGTLEDDFTLLGLCCAIVFFPLGILCCLAMRQRRCPNCGATFGWCGHAHLSIRYSGGNVWVVLNRCDLQTLNHSAAYGNQVKRLLSKSICHTWFLF